jgi:hypothetical protein
MFSTIVSSTPVTNLITVETSAPVILAAVGYAGFITSWKERVIIVDKVTETITIKKRYMLLRIVVMQQTSLTSVQSMQSTIDTYTNTVKVTIAQKNLHPIQFQLDINSFESLEQYLKTIKPEIEYSTCITKYPETGMLMEYRSWLY